MNKIFSIHSGLSLPVHRVTGPKETSSKSAWLLPVLLLLVLGLINTCEIPHGLEAVSGIQGKIEFSGDKPDSIKAVALVVLDPGAITDLENIGNYLINYSDPLDESGDYFIQLEPGQYMGVVVGLLIDPGLFVVNIDRYLESAELPMVQLTHDAVAFLIRDKEIENRDWTVTF